jgi:two-component system, LytTR family, sensor kinase
MQLRAGIYMKKGWVRECLFFVIPFVLMSLNFSKPLTTWYDFGRALVYFLVLYGQAQFHRLVLFPLLFHRQVKKFVLLTLVAVLVGSAVLYAVNYWLYVDCLGAQDWREFGLFQMATCVVSLVSIVALFLIQRLYQQQQNQHKDQMLLQEVKMKFLHAQLNPHFFFNTLNTLYGISLHQPVRMPDLLMQLSKLMRYQVDSSRHAWVSLQQEINFITSYVNLERERIGNRCRIDYSFPGETQLGDYQIAPLLLMPLIENAFKHGTGDIAGCFVSISITMNEDTLQLHIENSIPRHPAPVQSTGVGLPNTRQRLEILYSGKHRLYVQKNADRYETDLTIQLKSLLYAQHA